MTTRITLFCTPCLIALCPFLPKYAWLSKVSGMRFDKNRYRFDKILQAPLFIASFIDFDGQM